MLDLSSLGVTSQIWHMDPTDIFEALVEGEDGRIVVERSDSDEVSIHFMFEGDNQAVSSFYMNVAGAHALMGLLHIASAGDFSPASRGRRPPVTPEEALRSAQTASRLEASEHPEEGTNA